MTVSTVSCSILSLLSFSPYFFSFSSNALCFFPSFSARLVLPFIFLILLCPWGKLHVFSMNFKCCRCVWHMYWKYKTLYRKTTKKVWFSNKTWFFHVPDQRKNPSEDLTQSVIFPLKHIFSLLGVNSQYLPKITLTAACDLALKIISLKKSKNQKFLLSSFKFFTKCIEEFSFK